MKFILKLLERILESISGLYTSDQVDNLAEAKVDSESFNTALSAESEARISADEDLSNQIASAMSNQQALENVAEWQGYANAMQSMVDEDTAIQIAEEFEKAADSYLKDNSKGLDFAFPANVIFAGGRTNFSGEPLVEISEATESPVVNNPPTNLNGAFKDCKSLKKIILGGRYPVLTQPFSRDDIFSGCDNLEEICCPKVDSRGNPLYKARNHVGDWTGEYTTEQLVNPKTGELEPQALDNGLRYAQKESRNAYNLLKTYHGVHLGDFFCNVRRLLFGTKFTQNEVYIGDCIGYEVGYQDQWFLAYCRSGNPSCIKHCGDFINVKMVGAYMFYEAGKYSVGDFLSVTKFYGSNPAEHGLASYMSECLGVGVFPKLETAYAHFNMSTIPVMNIARLLRSFSIFDDGGEHKITLTKFASKLNEEVTFRQCYKDGLPVDEVTEVTTTLQAEIDDCVNRKGWTVEL